MLTYLGSKLKKIHQYFFKYQRPIAFVGFFIILVGCGSFFILKPAHAFDIIDWPNFGDSLVRALSGIFLGISRLLLKLALFFLEYVIIVAGYNGYLDSTAVNVGWIAVLNITNMLFVVILLIIAFATILGRTEYEWKKLLPKFFFAAILVNFSRTICGFLIDMSQVMMSAFVNAIAATIGGNVINGFQLDKIEKFNSTVKPGDLLAPGIFTASVAAVFFSAMVASVFGAYIFILVGRMIRLWILIVLSPLAFVLSVIPKTASFASQWWSELGDNLVTGPVLLFFIWLSLVTVGSGQINAHILARSNVPDANKATMDGTLYGQGFINNEKNTGVGATSEQSAGLTDILGWNNMANFIIAIGMLFAGAKVASKIGGSSGNLMMGAIGFGKKVATIATGVAAGEWVAGQVGKMAGKVPGYVGDMALSPLKRQVVKADALRRTVIARKQQLQNKWAVKAEGYGEGEKGVKGFSKRALGWAAARFVESGPRKDKIAEDYTDMAEEAEKITKINSSTSSVGAGPSKLRLHELARQEEEKAGAKKNQKFAEEQEKMEKKAEALTKIKKDLKDEGVSESDMSGALKARALGMEVEIGKDKKGSLIKEKVTGRDLDYLESREATLSAKAKGEQLSKQLSNAQAREVAAAKDKATAGGIGGGFLDQELDRQAKEARERAGVAGFDKSMAKIALINEKIQKEGNADLAKVLQKELNNLLLSNIYRGSMFGATGEERALASRGLSAHNVGAELNKDNLVNAQANFLSTKLGRNVENIPEKVDEAVKELEQRMGPAFMEQMVDGLGKMAEDGASHYAGLFRGEMKEGKYKIRATSFDKEKDYIEGKREWAISQSKFSKVQGFDACLDQEWDGAGKSMNTRIHSDKALENLEKIFKGINTNQLSRLDNNNVDTLARAIQNAKSSAEIEKIFETIKKAAAGNDGDKKKVEESLKESIRKSAQLKDKTLLEREFNAGAGGSGSSGGGAATGGGGKRNPNQRPRR